MQCFTGDLHSRTNSLDSMVRGLLIEGTERDAAKEKGGVGRLKTGPVTFDI
jgi:hypothetical protein